MDSRTWTTIDAFVDRAWTISEADPRDTCTAQWDAIIEAGDEYGLPPVHGFGEINDVIEEDPADPWRLIRRAPTFTDDARNYLGAAAFQLRHSLNPEPELADTIGAQLTGVSAGIYAWMEGDPGDPGYGALQARAGHAGSTL
ncbi:MAG TPA: hypothetical protein VIU11_18790 [Nakamurella sp.]